MWAAKQLAAEHVVRAMRQPQFEAGRDFECGARHLTAARSDDAKQSRAKHVLRLWTWRRVGKSEDVGHWRSGPRHWYGHDWRRIGTAPGDEWIRAFCRHFG